MSTTILHTEQQPRSKWYSCDSDNCSGVVTEADAIEGSYCSRECQLRARGQRLLNIVQNDHRFCYTCFRKLKEVYDVPAWRRRRMDPVTESVVTGFQHRTQHGDLGERTKRRPGTLLDDTRIGTICECGQTNHRDRENLIQSSSIKSVAHQLHATLEALRDEGQHTSRVSWLSLVDVLYAQYQHDDLEGYDFPIAVGIAARESDE